MLKNTLQFIRHNLKSGKSIMMLLSVVMIICGPVPAFLVFSDRLRDLRRGFLPTVHNIDNTIISLFSNVNYYHILLSLIAAVSGLVLAFVLFYYFRKKESADFFLSLPVTRTEAYIANFVSGTLYYVIPLVITSLITVIGLCLMGALDFVSISEILFYARENEYSGLLVLIGTNVIFFLLFFALGAIASLISSNGINALVVYGTINFYPIAFMGLLLAASTIFNNDILDFQENIIRGCLYITPSVRLIAVSELPATAWTYIITPIVAAGFAVLGCYLCNKRPAETWSSAIIFLPVRLTLQYMYCFIVAFAAGLFFYYITDRSIFNIVIGAILGLVLSFMILNIIFERDIKAIFKKPLRLVWSALIFIAVFVMIVMDVFGIFRYRQPAASSVDYVNVNLSQSISSSYYTSNMRRDYDASKIDDPEVKETAIKLYSLLHEEIRSNNYDYYLGRNTANIKGFDRLLRSHTSGISIGVEMMRGDKTIRPLRDSYFELREEYYELFKTIYNSEQYTDPMIPLLTHVEIKGATVTTRLIRNYGSGERFALKSIALGQRLRDALLADYAEADFDSLQTLSPYVLNVYYSTLPGEYADTSERVMVTEDYYGESYIEAERSINVFIPASFTRTIAIIEENSDMLNTIESLHEAIYDQVDSITVLKYESDEGIASESTTVTDRAEIKRIMDDLYYSTNRTPIFPKYGISLSIYLKRDMLEEDDKYYEYYKDAEHASTQRSVANTEFLQRFSTLY